jgi:hypothetical protein
MGAGNVSLFFFYFSPLCPVTLNFFPNKLYYYFYYHKKEEKIASSTNGVGKTGYPPEKIKTRSQSLTLY